MKFLSLDRLTVPGRSVAENFELLCLELVKATAGARESAAHRNAPPDGGIDIFNPDTKVAYQCKAYGHYRPDLIAAITESARKAKRTSRELPFRSYVLMIPFVPTKDQRQLIDQALAEAGARSYVCDGDELETRLYHSWEIASRFFPSVLIVLPPKGDVMTFSTDDSATVGLALVSVRTEQRLLIRASITASVNGLKNFLISQLRLPTIYRVDAASFMHSGVIRWTLALARDGRATPLSDERTLGDEGVCEGATLHLLYKMEATFEGGFLKEIGPHWEKAKIDSPIWDADEMNPDLMESKGSRADVGQLVDSYVDWHLARAQGSRR